MATYYSAQQVTCILYINNGHSVSFETIESDTQLLGLFNTKAEAFADYKQALKEAEDQMKIITTALNNIKKTTQFNIDYYHPDHYPSDAYQFMAIHIRNYLFNFEISSSLNEFSFCTSDSDEPIKAPPCPFEIIKREPIPKI